MTNTQVVQPRCRFPENIRTVGMGIAQDVFDTTRALDTRNGVLDPDADTRQGTIVALLPRGQGVTARLFFG